MSEGDPSLEEAVGADLPLLLRSPGGLGAVLIGSPSAAARFTNAVFIADQRRFSVQPPANHNLNTADVKAMERRSEELQATSVQSMYQDTMSVDMNTDRDNESVASTRLADEPTSVLIGETQATPAITCDMESVPLSPQRIQSTGNNSLFLRDGVRTVDFVLVWQVGRDTAYSDAEKREIFEKGLKDEGLQIEYEQENGSLFFVKIHAPQIVLKRYSEILKLRMPMKEDLCRMEKDLDQGTLRLAAHYLSEKLPGLRSVHKKTNTLLGNMNNCFDRIMTEFKVDSKVFPEKSHRFTAIYARDKEYLFDTDQPNFWSGSICSRIVQFVLDRQRFSMDKNNDFAFGIDRLVADGVYTAAYPLHDGDVWTKGSMRHLLYTEWASLSKFLRYQPLDYIKDYFGVKIALYFAWLGFYTHMLLPAAVVGLGCFIYSVSTLYTNIPSEDVCNDNSTVKMCPLCDYWCDYWELKETCLHSRVAYLFDNSTTVFFAVFMSFWAALFLELWKRYSAEITHRWDLTGFDVHEEHPRPQYLARLCHVKRKQVNVVTNTLEPYVPFWRMRLPHNLLSLSVVLLLVSLALAAVLAVVLYRMSILATLVIQRESVITSYAILFTTVTAACINLVLICIFNYVYCWLAEKLTEQELLRTQTEFDDSLTLKIYLLQFVNYYASIFYIAFFKGKFVGRPGKYHRILGFRQEECGPGGCLMELCIQLSIIMIGKQAVNTVMELALPIIMRWFYKYRTWRYTKQASIKSTLQWIKDYKLVEFGSRGLFAEYLEMVLQYGFVTIFVAAFPLAPLFALLNNVLEMRLDAVKLLRLHRRPVPQRVRDIGVWYRILDSIGKLSVITNGFIIAFTSEFIPRMVYRLITSSDGSLTNYLQQSLSVFNTANFERDSAPHITSYNNTICRYPDYRQSHDHKDQYQHTPVYWYILAARLSFVVVFENLVALVMITVRWLIPGMSTELRDRIRREAYVINEIIIHKERQRAGLLSPISPMPSHTGGELNEMQDWSDLLSRSESEFDLATQAAVGRGHKPPVDV